MKTVKYVDPPSGWMYGFPKEVPTGVVTDDQWFIDNGYPKALVDAGMLKWTRHFTKEVEDD